MRSSPFFFFFLPQVDTQYLRGPHITEVDREGLETAVLGLEFRLRTKHFKRGDLKIKCLATIATVYWKSNELSIEGERPLKMPVMESRETRAQGHTHAEHILGGKESGGRDMEIKFKKDTLFSAVRSGNVGFSSQGFHSEGKALRTDRLRTRALDADASVVPKFYILCCFYGNIFGRGLE